MNQFVQRVANYIANEILVKGLANSKTFQKFAVRTDHHLRKVREGGKDSMNAQLDELHKAAQEAVFTSRANTSSGSSTSKGPPIPPRTGFSGFVEAFGNEVKKDIGMGK
mmetsp:Transcript_29485/g.45007  ORF Transcript_29485/g.45007 Transcript_29485/m.45007 type:complete len:109 (+) Transcript_29485:90-416(+)